MEKTDAKKNTVETKDEIVEKLLKSIGDDPELREKLLSALAGADDKPGDAEQTAKVPAETEEENDDEEEDEDDDDGPSGESLGDFCDDGVIGLLVGFAAGAALIGGGVLLHKLVSRD